MSHGIAEAAALFAAGAAAGTINAVVGSGTLITFPTLLAFGYSPVTANVSNTVGLVPGVISGIHGYRRELKGQRARLVLLGTGSMLGGLTGAILLLTLPAGAFKAIVPALIALALVLVVAQPSLAAWVARRQAARNGRGESGENENGESSKGSELGEPDDRTNAAGGPLLWTLVFGSGVYGGYFGAAQGVLLLGLLGIAFTDSLQRINAAKNVLAALVNGVASVIFIAVSHIAWSATALIAAGSILGGQLGARIGRKLPPTALRFVIVCVGIVALVSLLA
ncbi:MAG TPA: sulfite exporter TauE/SafE family protein [Actinocrinis sp.]|uniref:sulfite exporter TauE/SafE family protein n=1 Tax=Actinocrinis sp. TaxID=1920516 RepID=UPI002DDD6739|nr:sulfite exporter TauE/SafE family protein [Actinocrinis sp.]HEV2347306.1 sulfite exporter TauE/SafE family protein [Actinocrinis sp.]